MVGVIGLFPCHDGPDDPGDLVGDYHGDEAHGFAL